MHVPQCGGGAGGTRQLMEGGFRRRPSCTGFQTRQQLFRPMFSTTKPSQFANSQDPVVGRSPPPHAETPARTSIASS